MMKKLLSLSHSVVERESSACEPAWEKTPEDGGELQGGRSIPKIPKCIQCQQQLPGLSISHGIRGDGRLDALRQILSKSLIKSL
jgi:hypothetical protein